MNQLRHDLKAAALSGGAVGGFGGLVSFIWAAYNHIQPALSTTYGLGNLKADFITLGIAVGGGLELSTLLGMVLGVMKALLLYFLVYLPIQMLQERCSKSPEPKKSEPSVDSSNEPQKPTPIGEPPVHHKSIFESSPPEIEVVVEQIQTSVNNTAH